MSLDAIPPPPHRPRPLLRRQRPPVRLLLSQRLRLRRDRLRRPGDRHAGTRPATSCARATSPSCWPRRCGPITRTPTASSSTATACRTSRWKSTTCAPPTKRPCRRGATGRHAADAAGGRARRLRVRRRSAPTATRRTPSSTATATTASSPPATSRSTPTATARAPSTRSACKAIDHIVGNVEEGKMDDWVDFYEQGPRLLAAGQLRRQGHQHRVLGPDVEGGAERPRPDQVPDQRAGQEPHGARRSRSILKFYDGPGVQHIALATGDIIETVRAMRHNDVSFLRVPPAYYDMLPERVGTIDEDMQRAGRAGHPRRPRRRGLHAADLHQAGRGPADAVLRDHRAARLAGASARATSRRCSRPSSANRCGGEPSKEFTAENAENAEKRKTRVPEGYRSF